MAFPVHFGEDDADVSKGVASEAVCSTVVIVDGVEWCLSDKTINPREMRST